MEYLTVDVDKRKIIIPESIEHLGVKDDNETRTLNFRMPSIYKGLDMSGYTIEINYINAKNKSDSALAQNVQVEGEEITFQWCAGGTVYAKDGKVRFLVYTYLENEDAIKTNEWHTTWAELKVLDGGNVEDQIAEENPRIIEEMLRRIKELENRESGGTKDAVQYIEQELTEEQQVQARTNIGAASADEVGELRDTVNDHENRIKAVENNTSVGGSGVTTGQANSLWNILKKTAFAEELTDEEITAFKTEWGITEEEPDTPVEPDNPEVTLTSISATYTGGEVAVGTSVNSLTGITVTATYSDGSTANVTGYTLSGTIAEGTNTITVSYGGKTSTFTVVGVAESGGDDTEGFVNLLTENNVTLTHTTADDVSAGIGSYAGNYKITDKEIQFSAGVTYYFYTLFKTTSGGACLLWKNDGSGVYTNPEFTATKKTAFKKENGENSNYGVVIDVNGTENTYYLCYNYFTPTEDCSLRLTVPAASIVDYPEYNYLFTKEYNPLLDSLE